MNVRARMLALITGLVAAGAVTAAPVDPTTARAVASSWIRDAAQQSVIRSLVPYPSGQATPVLFVAVLEPIGFVVVAGDSALPPVVGFSFQNEFAASGPWHDQLVSLLVTDLRLRLAQVAQVPAERARRYGQEWQRLLTGRSPDRLPAQWPPAGSTATGGWVLTLWSQNPPYNAQCPLDPVTHARSIAGCPAVAMAQILNYHRNANRTTFDDGDDYHHVYAGRNYWIDDDWASLQFPDFPTLSTSLQTLDQHYASQTEPTNADMAALVFACGVAATQVYTSQGSGTFGVDQAWDAYVRFGVEGITLITEDGPALQELLSQNMMVGLPAHLAVVDTAVPPQSGHNLVVDGYRDDGYFHLNFGYAGSYDGWYLIPSGIPFGLTVLEGVIVDITVPLLRDGFETGSTAGWTTTTP